MSSLQDVPQRPRFSLPRGLTPLLILALLFVGAVAAPGVLEQLLLGWIYFPLERLPRITVDPASVVLGIVCMPLFFVVLHVTLLWLVRALQPVQDNSPRRWSLRSTLIAGSAACLLFAAGTAMIGVTHQFVWMLTGRSEASTPPRGVVARARNAVSMTSQRGGLKILGLAVHNHVDAERTLPSGGTMTADGRLMHGWGVELLPYLSVQTGEFDFSKPWNEPPNAWLFRSRIPAFQVAGVSPIWDEHGYGLAHLSANRHVMPMVVISDESAAQTSGPMKLDEITDGTSNTLLIGEAAANFKPWGHPANIRDPSLGLNRSPDGFGSHRREGAFFLLADGSVRLISTDIDPEVLRRLGLPSDGEPSVP